jgi:hypothetical protein
MFVQFIHHKLLLRNVAVLKFYDVALYLSTYFCKDYIVMAFMSFHAETTVKLFVDFTAKVNFLVFMLLAEESLGLVFKISDFIK